MRKLLISLLAVSSTASFAVANNSEFQEFDNQISIGWGMNSTTANSGTGGGGTYSSTGNMLNLEGERLFNNGVWVDVNANMQFGGGSTTPTITNPYIAPSYGLNGKVGYAFSLANQHLLLTPYALVGINNNISSFTGEYGQTATPGNTANNFYYTGGVGGRLEYRITRSIELFADQNAAYNWDQSQPSAGIAPQNFASYTSTLGAKFNLAPDFQLGVRGFYTALTQEGSNSIPGTGYNFAQACSGYGGLISVGLTY